MFPFILYVTIRTNISNVIAQIAQGVDICIMAETETEQKERESTTQNKKIFLEEFEKSFGIITIAVLKAGISRRTYYYWIENDPVFKSQCDELEKFQIDYVNDKLIGLIAGGNPSAIMFFLKSRNEKYREKMELTGDIAVRAEFANISDEDLIKMLNKAKEIEENGDSTKETE